MEIPLISSTIEPFRQWSKNPSLGDQRYQRVLIVDVQLLPKQYCFSRSLAKLSLQVHSDLSMCFYLTQHLLSCLNNAFLLQILDSIAYIADIFPLPFPVEQVKLKIIRKNSENTFHVCTRHWKAVKSCTVYYCELSMSCLL